MSPDSDSSGSTVIATLVVADSLAHRRNILLRVRRPALRSCRSAAHGVCAERDDPGSGFGVSEVGFGVSGVGFGVSEVGIHDSEV